MEMLEFVFLLQFLVCIGVVLWKVYNTMSPKEQKYDIRMAFLLFFIYFLSYGVGFVVFMLDLTNNFYRLMFQLETWIILLNVLFIMVELFQYISVIAERGKKQRYNPSLEV